jgi:hypothetical protein
VCGGVIWVGVWVWVWLVLVWCLVVVLGVYRMYELRR